MKVCGYTVVLLCIIAFRAFAGINIMVSPGLDSYKSEIGFNTALSVHYPLRLFNQPLTNINPGIKLFSSYLNSDRLIILNYGGGLDLGYIFNIEGFLLTPSICAGFQFGDITLESTVIGRFNSLVLYPSISLGLTVFDNLILNCIIGYKINFINKISDGIPDTINNITINFSVGYNIADILFPQPQVYLTNVSTNSFTNNQITRSTNIAELSEKTILNQTKDLVNTGNKKEAIELLESYLEIYPQNTRIIEMLTLLKSKNIDLITNQ